MWKSVCPVIGFVVGTLAVVLAFFASVARIESFDELASLRVLDVVIGGMFAAALVLVAAPSLLGSRTRRYVVLAAAVVLWAAVSGELIWEHEAQVRARSGLPGPSVAEP